MYQIIILIFITCFLYFVKSRVIFTIYESGRNLEELIGSIHHHTSDIKVLVFGYSYSTVPKDEITLWRHVRFVDIQHEIKYSTNPETIDDLYILKLHLFEYIFEEEFGVKAIFIQSGYLFDKRLLSIENGIGKGFEVYTKTGGYEGIIKPRLSFLRGLGNGNENFNFITLNGINLPRVSNYFKWSCSIKIRSELIFSGLLSRHQRSDYNTSVAFMVPTKNQNENVKECALINYLIPSITRTCYDSNNFTLYVGYDRDDPVFKDQSKRDLVKNLTSFKVKFYEIPKTGGWLTFIWNYLYVEAYKDGNEYFVQVNDDVKFLKSGWLNSSISLLPKEAKGVVGFNDIPWQCKLYTQTLVNRNHYKMFKGHYFPLKLRNWYSDNWITTVYENDGGTGTCNEEAVISNGNLKTRYEPCYARNYKDLIPE